MKFWEKKADAEIYAFGYDRGDGLDASVEVKGTAKTIATLCTGIIENCSKGIEKKDGMIGSITFAAVILSSLEEVNPDAYKLAMKTLKLKKATELGISVDARLSDLVKKKLDEMEAEE